MSNIFKEGKVFRLCGDEFILVIPSKDDIFKLIEDHI